MSYYCVSELLSPQWLTTLSVLVPQRPLGNVLKIDYVELGSLKTVPWNRRPPQKGSIEPLKRFYRTPIKRFYFFWIAVAIVAAPTIKNVTVTAPVIGWNSERAHSLPWGITVTVSHFGGINYQVQYRIGPLLNLATISLPMANTQGHWTHRCMWHSKCHSQERRGYLQNPLWKKNFLGSWRKTPEK